MSPTRRTFLRLCGSGLVAGVGLSGSASATGRVRASHGRRTWQTVATPTGRTLTDVTHANGRAYAVGGGGVVLERRDGEWRTVLESGPTGNGNNLNGVDATASGRHVWFVGASGTVGVYDTETGDVTSRSAPGGVTNNLTDVAVTGESNGMSGDGATSGDTETSGDGHNSGDETDGTNVYVADASGTVHASFAGGADGSWTRRTPGSGASIRDLDFYGARRGVLVDGNRAVLATTDGRSWSQIGIEDADHSLVTVDADGHRSVRVAGGGGTVYERDGDGWNAASPVGKTLEDVSAVPCGCVFAVGGGGLILHYRPGHGADHSGDGHNSGHGGHHSGAHSARHGTHDGDSGARRRRPGGWHVAATPTGENLAAISLGDPHIAVGASGTVLER